MKQKWKTILVTGGSSGIGLALVEQLIGQSELVLAIGRRTYEECGRDFPLKPEEYLSMDLAAEDAPQKAAAWVREQSGEGADLIIHDAGVGYTGPIASLGPDSAARMFAVNLRAPVLLTRALMDLQNNKTRTTLVFVSSVVSNLPSPAYAAYTATKAAINGFVRNLAAERSERYRVVAVHPGATATPMHHRAASEKGISPVNTKGFAAPDDVARIILRKISKAVDRDSHIRYTPIGIGNTAILSASLLFPRLMARLRRNPAFLEAEKSPTQKNSNLPPRVLITGAASGIGLALTQKYLESGYTVYALDRDLAGLEAVKNSGNSDALQPFKCDLTEKNQIHSVALEIPRLDIVIHNAGLSVFGKFENQNSVTQDTVLKVNALAPLLLEQELMQQKKADALTRRAFLSSLSAFVGYPGAAVYAATKDFVKSYGESLAAAMPGKVTLVYPGPTRTPHARRYSPDNSRESKRMPPEVLAGYIVSAIAKGKPRLIPGAGLRAFAFTGRVMPRFTESSLRKSLMEPLEGRVLE